MRERQFRNRHIWYSQSSTEKTEELVAFLTQIDLFRALSAEELLELDRATTVITCSTGKVFYRPGETGNVLFLLRAGRVQLYHLSTDGRKLITATLEAGACFGEMPLIGQGMYNSFAEAVEESWLCLISKHEIEHLFAQKPAVTVALLRLVSQRMVQLEAQLIDATFKSATARLATLLLQLARPANQQTDYLAVDGFSQEELAERLGVYRETVSVSLRDLREAGTIELRRKHITITHPEKLKDIAST